MTAPRTDGPLLVTGFEAFGAIADNPSRRLVEALARERELRGHALVAEVLPTEYSRGAHRLLELLDAHDPRAVVALGVAGGSTALRLERIARNLDDHDAPDNAGERRQRHEIVHGAPARLVTTLPIEAMGRALRQHGIPVEISEDAGSYVCNHVFYRLCHALAEGERRIPAGFVHVPDPSDPRCIAEGLDLDRLQRALAILLETILAPRTAAGAPGGC